MRRALLFFVDGVGIGEADPQVNPVVSATLPVLDALLDGVRPVLGDVPIRAHRATALGLDATLGVDGIPQSGTGQTALFTGRNAAAEFGRHFGPWVPTMFRAMLGADGLLARIWGSGRPVAFANAYPEELVSAVARNDEALRQLPPFLRAAPPLSALGIGALNRHTEALRRGDAVASEITNEAWRERLGRTELPVVSPAKAGTNLARIVEAHALTLFAHYSTDSAGHGRDMAEGIAAIERVDAFLGGLLAALPSDVLIVMVSDHGNLEDVRTGHTRNPALCVVCGDDHRDFAAPLHSLLDVAPALERWLRSPSAPAEGP
jgi:2,3-bisphosphoglycerate-independent phosphoglycerate mutase